MPELLSPAGSPEGVTAALQSGADAIYVSFGVRPDSIGGLTDDELQRAAEFCRIRGAKIYAVLDAIPFDDDFSVLVSGACRAQEMGVDAIIAHDIGLIYALRQAVPEMPIHAGSRLNIHNLEGVHMVQAMGCRRVAIAKELPLAEIKNICANSSIEIEVLIHGHNCMSYSGQCRLSAFSGGGSAARGECSRICLREYSSGTKVNRPLTMKETCLISHLDKLSQAGVAAVRIEGRNRGPEYGSVTADVYSRALKTGRVSNQADMGLLAAVSSNIGFTDAYLADDCHSDMLAAPPTLSVDGAFLTAIRKGYLNREYQRVPVSFSGSIALGEPAFLSAADDQGNTAQVTGPHPQLAFHQELTQTLLQTELYKTGGTPFYCDGIRCAISPGIIMDPTDIGQMRDKLLAELYEKRKDYIHRLILKEKSLPDYQEETQPPVLTVSVSHVSQLSQKILKLAPPVIYIPLTEIPAAESVLEPYLQTPGIAICAILPPVIWDDEKSELLELLRKASHIGIHQVSCQNIGQLISARKLGFQVRGDLGLDVRNSRTMHVLSSLGMSSVILSPEMDSVHVRSVAKAIPAELAVYGRLPLMYTQSCIPKACTGVCSCESFTGINDEHGFTYPVIRSFSCRNTVFSPKKLFLAHRASEYMNSGLWGVRLMFTTENTAECAAITERYLGLGDYEPLSFIEGYF